MKQNPMVGAFTGHYLGKMVGKGLMILIFLIRGEDAYTQKQFSKHELSINGFRNPSIGLEYRYKQVSAHAGYYTTAFQSGTYTNFIKTGLNYWFLPVGKKENPSSFYAGGSYLRGLTREYKGENAFAADAGFRWMVGKGLNLRLGVTGILAKGQPMKINPTPGISYSFNFK